MLIESIIRRKGGSRIPMGKTTYHFKPEKTEDGPHVAVVTDRTHIQRFLAIPEGYAIAEEDAKPVPKTVIPPVITAPTPPETTPEPTPEPDETATNEGGDETTTGDETTEEADASSTQGGTEDKALEDLSRDELMAIYEAEFDRKPHPKSENETMIERIKQNRAEKGAAA